MEKLLVISLISVLIAATNAAIGTFCVQCNSGDDVRCAVQPETYLAKECSNASNTTCYWMVKDGKTIRGCFPELTSEQVGKCQEGMDCGLCGSTGCNNQIAPVHRTQCLQCKGGLNDTCATDTSRPPTVCPIYKLGDYCIIRKKTTSNEFVRDCLSSYEKLCADESNCYRCEGHGCNFIPKDDASIPEAKNAAVKMTLFSLLLLFAIFINV